MAKKKSKAPEKSAREEPSASQNRANVRPERMQHSPVQETEAGQRARVRQPIMRVDHEKGHEWYRTSRKILGDGWFLSNADMGQYKALVWRIEGSPSGSPVWRAALRGQPPCQPDFGNFDEARGWARMEVERQLDAGWNPYLPVKQRGKEAPSGTAGDERTEP